jgi:hypothetical protein
MFESVESEWREDKQRSKKSIVTRAWIGVALAWIVCLILILEKHWK